MTASTVSVRHRGAALVALAAIAVAAAVTAASAGTGRQTQPDATGDANVIVRVRHGQEARATIAVEKLGGAVRTQLRIIGGFSASVPGSALARLRRERSILSVSLNTRLHAQSVSLDAAYDPVTDGYSMDAVTTLSGAQDWWRAGYTGRGVDVALIDSGVAPVEGLSGSGKLLNGPDLSLESQAPNLRYLDSYGHGTFMAGLIAGHGDAQAQPYDESPATVYKGMAPDARIVSLKVATADGGTDTAQVIAAIDWVVQHRADTGLNIRVINLSYGTNSLQHYRTDPLAFAAEQAWKRGLVVVASAGNTGFQRANGAPGLADPAYDPYVIGVAAADTLGTRDLGDDVVAPYSATSCGGTCKDPDLAAPGSHMQGLRVPNSFIDANHPEGFLDERFFRGSGTSEAAALVSGAVALVLQRYPNLTPDQVKGFLTKNAAKMSKQKREAQGAGELDLAAMLGKTPADSTQKYKDATGTGTLEDARGQDHIARDGVVLAGERDIFGAPVDTGALAAAEAAGNSWSGGVWNGSSWSGNSWSGSSWSGSTWSGNSWSGTSWSSSAWTGNSWSGSTWSGSSWSGSSWSGTSWTGESWASAFWG